MKPVIVIFGAAVRPDGSPSGAMRVRVAAAVATARALAAQGREGVTFMPTGGVGRWGPAEAVVMAGLLERAGVAREAITIEPTGRNTLRSVLACAAMLEGRRAEVFVASSGYHLLRCVLLLRLAGVRARAGCRPGAAASTRWTKRWRWRLREVPAVPVDSALLLLMRLKRWTERRRVRARP